MTAIELQRKRAIREYLKTNQVTVCALSYGEPNNYRTTIPYYALGATK